MVRKDRKQLVLALIVVLVMFVLSFAFTSLYKTAQDNKNKKYVLDTSFKTSKNVYLENTLPISNELGKQYDGSNIEDKIHGYNEFTIENNYSKNITYEVYLKENNKCEKVIDKSYVIFYLTNSKDEPLDGFKENKLPSFASLPVLSDKPNAKLLYSGTIKNQSKEKFKLRVWVSDLYSINKDKECFSFDIYVRIV